MKYIQKEIENTKYNLEIHEIEREKGDTFVSLSFYSYNLNYPQLNTVVVKLKQEELDGNLRYIPSSIHFMDTNNELVLETPLIKEMENIQGLLYTLDMMYDTLDMEIITELQQHYKNKKNFKLSDYRSLKKLQHFNSLKNGAIISTGTQTKYQILKEEGKLVFRLNNVVREFKLTDIRHID